MTKLVSVVVTCYNHEEYIEQCLRSVFSQTYQEIELLVFNDGSTDNSGEIIEKVLQDSPFTHTEYLYHANQGIVATRNRAFDKINGDFLLFVDSDNFLSENFIEAMYEIMEAEKADIVYTKLVNPDNQVVLISQMDFDLRLLYKENFIDNCSLIRRSIIGDVRYDDQLKKMVDYDLFMNLIVNKGAKAVGCDETCIYYRVLDNSISHHGDTRKFYEAYSIIIGKYMVQYPEYAKSALEFNFERAIHLSDPLSEYLQEKITVYYTTNNEEMSEERSIRFTLLNQDNFTLTLPANTDTLRVDLTELPSYFTSFSIEHCDTKTELFPILGNGTIIDNGVIFSQNDPQLYYNVSKFETKEFQIQYKLFNITNPIASDYIGQILGMQNFSLKNELKVLHQQITQLKKEHQSLRTQHSSLNEEYHRVIGSRRWVIPTKIINFLRRAK